jgi:hypothetical protein
VEIVPAVLPLARLSSKIPAIALSLRDRTPTVKVELDIVGQQSHYRLDVAPGDGIGECP